MFGFGSRAAALAGAASAVVDDGSANYYNPAALARQGDLRIDVGYQAAQPRLALNGRDSGVDATRGFTVGLVAPGELFGARFAFGVALFLPDGWISRVRTLAFAQPRWAYYDNRTQRLFLAANLAVRLWRGLSVGGGLAFMSRTTGDVALRGLVALANTDTDSRLYSSVHVDLIAIRYPQAGLVWEATRWLTLAATYRHSFTLSLDQGLAVAGKVGDPVVASGSLTGRTRSLDLFQPWQLTVGGALRVTRWLLVACDLTFARWSAFETPAANFQLALDLGPNSPFKFHLPSPRSYPPPGFHDILIPRLGVEVRALERERVALDVRGGYSYEPTPVPEQIGESNYADADKHRFTVGAGVTLRRLSRYLPGSVTLDAHFGVTALPSRANRKADALDPVGDYRVAGTVVEGGVTNRWTF